MTQQDKYQIEQSSLALASGATSAEGTGLNRLRTEQPPLWQKHKESFCEEDYIVVSSNRDIYSRVLSWPRWDDTPITLVTGPVDSGKSHIAAIWSKRSNAETIDARDSSSVHGVAGTLINGSSNNKSGEDKPVAALVVENAHLAKADTSAPLFELVNFSLLGQLHIFATAETPVGEWTTGMQDLHSRWKLAVTYRLEPPSDELLVAVLTKMFDDRQLLISPKTILYIVARIERSIAAAKNAVSRIDEFAMANQSGVSIKVVAQALGWI